MGFYEQDRDTQLALLAYHQIAREPNQPIRKLLLNPITLDSYIEATAMLHGKKRQTISIASSGEASGYHRLYQGVKTGNIEQSALDWWTKD